MGDAWDIGVGEGAEVRVCAGAGVGTRGGVASVVAAGRVADAAVGVAAGAASVGADLDCGGASPPPQPTSALMTHHVTAASSTLTRPV